MLKCFYAGVLPLLSSLLAICWIVLLYLATYQKGAILIFPTGIDSVVSPQLAFVDSVFVKKSNI